MKCDICGKVFGDGDKVHLQEETEIIFCDKCLADMFEDVHQFYIGETNYGKAEVTYAKIKNKRVD